MIFAKLYRPESAYKARPRYRPHLPVPSYKRCPPRSSNRRVHLGVMLPAEGLLV